MIRRPDGGPVPGARRVASFVVLLAAAVGAAPLAAQAGGPATGTPEELDAIARARIEAARLRFTAADVRFMTAMIAHHAQAVVMARLAPERAASPAVRTLAARIINAQADEIAAMQQWLRDRGQPVPDPEVEAAHAGHGAHHGHGGMPGMLTPAELEALAAARGPAFDRLFLQSMIAHHRGATGMVKTLFATDGAGQDTQVFKFASDVNVDQTTEIARMEKLLAALPPADAAR